MKSGCQSAVNKLGNVANVEGNILAEINTQSVSNRLMKVFTNRVALRIAYARRNILDSETLQNYLKVEAHKLCSTIMDTANGARVLREP
jgi:hypothetical protein